MEVSDRVLVLDHGAQAGRGHAGRGAPRPARDRGLPRRRDARRARRRRRPMLEVAGLASRYGRIPALAGVDLHVGRRRAGGAGRRQRRRQDDAAARALGRAAGHARHASRFDGADIARRARRASACGCGIVQVPEGRQVFGAADGRGQPAARRLRARLARPRSTRVYALFPVLREKRPRAGRHAVGRPAADAGDRPRADGRAAAAAARRAEHGPGAAAGGRDLRATSRRSRRAARRSCWWTRTRAPRWPSPTAASAWRPAASCCPGRAAELLRDPQVQQAYLGH